MSETPILLSVLASQGCAVFEYLGDGAFRRLSLPPDWYRELCSTDAPEGNSVRLSERFPFLEAFLPDAEAHWNARSEIPATSGVWIERQPGGRELALEARAFFLEGKRLFLVQNPQAAYEEERKWLQLARDSSLDHERLLREIQKKEILLHCIVHDLSQPLGAMRACFTGLSDGKLPRSLHDFATTGTQQADRQEAMIRGILEAFAGDLAAQEARDEKTERGTDLVAVERVVVQDFSAAFAGKGARIRLAPHLEKPFDARVAGDESRLRRIFGNLVENALRYSPRGSTVTLGINDEGSVLLAYVNDEGPGLPKDASVEKLFALFARGKDRAGKAGLGLYFCKITVERWGGTVGAETRPDGGSRFWFRLPKAASTVGLENPPPKEKTSAVTPEKKPGASERPARRAPSGRPGKGAASSEKRRPGSATRSLRILLVEDIPVNRMLTVTMIKKRGHRVHAVENGREAVAAWKQHPFDVILMDEEMPEMNGIDATRAIRQQESAGKHTIIIGLTGNATQEDLARCVAAGMDACLGKPVHFEELYKTIEGFFASGKMEMH
jgi:signal transduction histidine kinase/ActR/RegA family two-component response regulator